MPPVLACGTRRAHTTLEILQLLIIGVSQGCVYGLIALGFVLIYKATEMVNFAQGDMMMLGAFIAFSLIEAFDWLFASRSGPRSALPGASFRLRVSRHTVRHGGLRRSCSNAPCCAR